jgi:hypothetical protein
MAASRDTAAKMSAMLDRSSDPGGLRQLALSCEARAIRWPLAFALLAVLLLLALACGLLGPSYDTNDDVFLTMIAAGRGFCPAPDEHLIFTNILIGRLLKGLYTQWPSVPWYGGYLLTVHFLAQVALLYCALTCLPLRSRKVDSSSSDNGPDRGAFRRRLGTYLVYFAVVELVLLNSMQFTTTAFLCAQAGIFLLCLAAGRCRVGKRGVLALPMTAAVLMLVLASMIRLEGLYMSALVATPLVALLAWHLPRRAVLVGATGAAAAGLLVTMAAWHHHQAYARDPAWSGFYTFNQLRCKFNDYQWTSYTPQTAGAFAAVGWSQIDHDMIARWFFDDPEIYSEANLRSVLDGYPWKSSRWTLGYFAEIPRRPLQDRAVWAVLLTLPFFFMGRRDRQVRGMVVVCAVLALGLVMVIGLNNKVPPMRTYFPLLSFPLAVLLLCPSGARDGNDSSRASRAGVPGRHWLLNQWLAQPHKVRVAIALLLVGACMGIYRQCRRSVRVHRERQALEAFAADARAQPHKLYVCWEAALPFELLSPLDSLSGWSGISLVNLTWTQRTVWQDAIKRRF